MAIKYDISNVVHLSSINGHKTCASYHTNYDSHIDSLEISINIYLSIISGMILKLFFKVINL